MKPIERIRAIVPLSMRDIVGSQAWGTDFGAQVFSQLNSLLIGQPEGTLVPIDYGGLERTDVSFQREAIVESLRKHRPRLLFVADHLSDPDVLENLSLALERRGESLVVRTASGTRVVGRRLSPVLSTTLERARKSGVLTSSDLVTQRMRLSTASSRLTFLWKAGLLERVEGTAPTGGREHRYYPIY
jgi:hypothetical protein